MKKINNKIVFIIGAQKSGTTWLHEILQQISSFSDPGIKEINFYLNRSWVLEHRKQQIYDLEKNDFQITFNKKVRSKILNGENISFEDYCEILNLDEDTTSIDNSPLYSSLNKAEIARILENFPRAKFIYVLRDPLDRLLSQANMQDIKIFDRQHFFEIEEKTELFSQSNYLENVKNYVSICPGKILLLDFADISVEPLNLIKKILVFLDIPTSDTMLESLININEKFFHFPDKNLNRDCVSFLNEIIADNLIFYNHIFNKNTHTLIQ
jgi:hypothetical protein